MIIPPPVFFRSSGIYAEKYGSHFLLSLPNDGSTLMNIVTATVAAQQTITIQKKPAYPSHSCRYPATMPGSIMLRAMNAVQRE